MLVVCPDGLGPGDLIVVDTPDGRAIEAVVPEGVSPGDEFEVSTLDTAHSDDEDDGSLDLEQALQEEEREAAALRDSGSFSEEEEDYEGDAVGEHGAAALAALPTPEQTEEDDAEKEEQLARLEAMITVAAEGLEAAVTEQIAEASEGLEAAGAGEADDDFAAMEL